MSVSSERERVRVHDQLRSFQLLELASFPSGRTLLLGSEPLPLLISVGIDPRAPQRHLISFGGRVHVPPLVQRLACGVLDEGGDLFAVRRTDTNGQFAVDLPDGQYRLRFVVEVRDPIDVQVLERLADDAAVEQLEVAASLDTLTAELREAVQRMLDARQATPAEPEQALDLPRIAASLGMALAHNDSEPPPERDRGWWLAPEQSPQRLVFRCPTSHAEFPYGVVLVELRDGGRSVAMKLLAVDQNLEGTHYGNSLPLEALLEDRPFTSSMRPVFWANSEVICRRGKLDEVDALLASPYVSQRPYLAERLRRLRDKLARPK
ncbi:MAG: hypothetical protein NTY19_50615 [Planctomycetota bacterium]|nr:hypothetical protein [Planctomycetota bacterium]